MTPAERAESELIGLHGELGAAIAAAGSASRPAERAVAEPYVDGLATAIASAAATVLGHAGACAALSACDSTHFAVLDTAIDIAIECLADAGLADSQTNDLAYEACDSAGDALDSACDLVRDSSPEDPQDALTYGATFGKELASAYKADSLEPVNSALDERTMGKLADHLAGLRRILLGGGIVAAPHLCDNPDDAAALTKSCGLDEQAAAHLGRAIADLGAGLASANST